MKFLKNLFLVTLISIFLISCSNNDKKIEKQSQLIFGLASEPERLNPITIKDPQTFPVSWQIFEGLFSLDEEGHIIPVLAVSWETKDNIKWIFKIRKDVKFHEADIFETTQKTHLVTGEDVIYSYTRFCSPESYSSFVLSDSIKGCGEYSRGKANGVEGIKLLDEYTVQIELNKPEPFFIKRLTSPWIAIFPKESEKIKDKWGLSVAIGTGPYKLSSKTDNEIVLEKNENYWDKKRIANIDKVVFRILKNDQIRFSELDKGKIDLMALPNNLFSYIFDKNGKIKPEYSSKFNFKTTGTFNTHLIGINLKKITDLHLRKAMFLGVNREEMIKSILYGYGDIIYGAIPPDMNGYKSFMLNPYNPEVAKLELKQSDYKGQEIELFIHELSNSEQIGQIFQKQMNDIGIKIKLTKTDFNSLIGKMIKGETELFSMFAEIVFSSPEPLLLNLFKSEKIPVPNFWGFSNQAIDKQLEALRDIKDTKQSLITSSEIEKEILEDVPGIFLYRQKNVVIYSKKFKNLMINGHNYFMLEQLEQVK